MNKSKNKCNINVYNGKETRIVEFNVHKLGQHWAKGLG